MFEPQRNTDGSFSIVPDPAVWLSTHRPDAEVHEHDDGERHAVFDDGELTWSDSDVLLVLGEQMWRVLTDEVRMGFDAHGDHCLAEPTLVAVSGHHIDDEHDESAYTLHDATVTDSRSGHLVHRIRMDAEGVTDHGLRLFGDGFEVSEHAIFDGTCTVARKEADGHWHHTPDVTYRRWCEVRAMLYLLFGREHLDADAIPMVVQP